MGVLYFGRLLKKTTEHWIADEPFRLSAALAYYALFSIAPLLIIVTLLVGLVYSGDTVEQVRSQFATYVSPQAADLIARGVVHAGSTLEGGLAYSAFAAVLVLIGASAFTYQLQNAVNTIWKVEPERDKRLFGILKSRLGTLVFVLAAALVLQVTVVVSSAISVYQRYMSAYFPRTDFVWPWLDHGVSFAVVTAIFALIYKLLPNAKADWRDIMVGALLTAALFNSGKWIIAFYLSKSSFQSIYGAAGSAMVLLAWLYYSSLILLFGAEFMKVWVESRGRMIEQRRRAA